MKVLLTGANGQVGREVAEQAAEKGIQVVGFPRSALDITDADAVAEAIEQTGPGMVINAAAYTAVDKAEQEADLAMAINGDGPGHLARACAARGIPLIHISTDYVYDGSKDSPYLECDPVNPQSIYGRSKVAGERAVTGALDKHIILRTSWVFGRYGNNFVKTVLRLARAGGGPLRIVADQHGAPTGAASLAACILALVRTYGRTGKLTWGTYNYSGAPYTSWHGFALEIVRQAREIGLLSQAVNVLPITTDDFATPAKRPANSRLDTTRAVNVLACSPQNWRTDLRLVLSCIKSSETFSM